MHHITPQECSRIAQDLQIRKVQVESVVQLLDEGNTVPFITRYRKERTGGLNEDVIRQIQSRAHFLRQQHDRKQTILKTIDTQGKLTPELREAILKADTAKRLEDLYLPYKPKKRTLATTAREKGLEPLAQAIWYSDPAAEHLDELLSGLVNPEKELKTPDDVRLGVQHILAEMTAETASVRATVRHVLWETGKVSSAKSDKVPDGQGLEYKDYFQFSEPARQIPAHRILALNRGEKEGVVKVRLEFEQEAVHQRAIYALAEHLLTQAGKTPPAATTTPSPGGLTPPGSPAVETPAATAPETVPPAENPGQGEANVSPPVEAAAPPISPPEDIPAVPAPAADQPSPGLVPAPPPVELKGEPLVPNTAFKSPHAEFFKKVLEDALGRLLLPSLEREIRAELTDEAEGHAVSVFARNLRSLLLQPPLRNRRILAIDPGYRTGCKLALLDEYGNLLEHAVIHPFAPLKRGKDKAVKPQESAPAAAPEPTGGGSAPVAEAAPVVEVAAVADTPAPVVMPVPAADQPAPPTEAVAATEAVVNTTPVAAATPEGLTPPGSPEAAPPPPPEAPPPDRKAESRSKIGELIRKHAVQVVALGNGTGCRETEEIIAEVIAHDFPELSYVIINEAGASVYSVSPVGREEFPDLDATTRGTVSIGRRLQDPLSELVKVDPQHIGVGLYQHDLGRKELKESLDAIVESCVNQVGVDVNTASVPLLRYVSGLNQMVARELVEYRKQHGPFANRDALQQVPGLGPQRFVQSAGFLKVSTGSNPLDRTWIHPESYPVAEQILTELGSSSAVLADKAGQEELHGKLKALQPEELARRLNVGIPTVEDIVQALARPGRDPREELPEPIFKKGILKLEDLQAGMELKGTVLNVVDFGAFVDIGLKDSGLVHISQMANRYIKSPYDVVAVNDVVTVWVLAVDKERNRVSLTMIKPGTERKPLEKPAPRAEGRPPRGRGRQPAPAGAPAGQGQGGPGPGGDRAPRGRQGPPPRGGRGPHPAAAGRQPDRPTQEQAPARPAEQPRPAPPPQRRRREPPRPKLSQDAIEGKVPLRTFSELSALFAAKREPPAPPPVAASADATPPAPVEEPPKPAEVVAESPVVETSPPAPQQQDEAPPAP